MRKKFLFNDNWKFAKDNYSFETSEQINFEEVTVPHTWNNFDGQDGGGDYYRNTCWYKNSIAVTEKDLQGDIYLEFEAVNSIAVVYINGKEACKHEGGFSTFRVHLNDYVVVGENEIVVSADNGVNDYVYPQFADFTFFGGIYRNVNLIYVNKAHFDLDYAGGPGIMVTPVLNDKVANVNIKGFVTNPENYECLYEIYNDGKKILSEKVAAENGEADFEIIKPHLWNGRKDPHLYKLVASIVDKDAVLDQIEVNFGIRSFRVDPNEGFFLNDKSYPLRGVSRHQDRKDMGWAITEKEHLEDMELIKEVGATTIRLAHYQHAQFFYDLCDKEGMVLWAEIPYISSHMDNGRDNVFSQMKELVVQNYNHPSIVCWGLSNEITMRGETERLVQDHRDLNDYVHEMDKTRLTTIAQVSMVPKTSVMNHIPDIVSYNHYFGWYTGTVDQNGPWLDSYHEINPNICVGLSEYGCEAILDWHSETPKQGDYTEEYQAYYHEEMLKTFETRPYLWATHVWNMFDFAADSRDEGGKKGGNHKGLVTYDRSIKKDSFYIYKAYWNKDDKFVHICSRRYEERALEEILVHVYSNLDEVQLYHNGNEVALENSGHHKFTFKVKLEDGKNIVEAVSGEYKDIVEFTKVAEENPKYHFSDGSSSVTNWFDKDGNEVSFNYPEGYLNIECTMSDMAKNPIGKPLLIAMMSVAMAKMGMGNGKIDESMLEMASTMKLSSITKFAGGKITPQMLYGINEVLNKIPVDYTLDNRVENKQQVQIGKHNVELDLPVGYLNVNSKIKDFMKCQYTKSIFDMIPMFAPKFDIKKMGLIKKVIMKQIRVKTILSKAKVSSDTIVSVNEILNKIKK